MTGPACLASADAGSVVEACPTCGRPVECDTDGSGYGMTIAQCTAHCGYWRTLVKVARPALTRRVRAVLPRDRPSRRRRVGYGTLTRTLVSVLPTDAAEGLSARRVALRTNTNIDSTTVTLAKLAKAGLVQRVSVAGSGKRSVWCYWRRDA